MNFIQKKQVATLFANTELDDIITNNMYDCETLEQFNDYIGRLIAEREIIYYSNAINYLANNDASLRDSLALASECGLILEELNSESLANLLLQHRLQESLDDSQSELEDIFNEID